MFLKREADVAKRHSIWPLNFVVETLVFSESPLCCNDAFQLHGFVVTNHFFLQRELACDTDERPGGNARCRSATLMGLFSRFDTRRSKRTRHVCLLRAKPSSQLNRTGRCTYTSDSKCPGHAS